jgi:cytochrome c biogenesis protein CcdA
MILFVLAYLGGALTIVSPCILPVLPFVFARADATTDHTFEIQFLDHNVQAYAFTFG